jgi:AAA domain
MLPGGSMTDAGRCKCGGKTTEGICWRSGVPPGQCSFPVNLVDDSLWLQATAAQSEPQNGGENGEGRAGKLRAALLDSPGLDTIPEPQPVIDGLLYTDSLAWLTGKRGSGKSFVALDMAGCVSLGISWHGRAAKQGAVLYIAAEGAPGLRARVRAWEDHHGQMAVTFLPGDKLALRLPADATAIGMIAAKLAAVLVIIDTQSRVTVGLDENSSRDMGLLVDALERIREPSGACVLPVHHEPRNSENPRGHSSMDGAGTTLLRAVKDGSLITVTNPKQKDAPEADSLLLALTPHLGSAVLSPTSWSNDHLRTDSEAAVRKALLDLVGLKGGASHTELKTACTLAPSTFNWALKSLISKGEVRNAGTSKRTFYVMVQPGEETL